MFRRLLWLLIGAGFGFGVAFWVMRLVREAAARYSPDRLSSDLAQAARGFGTDLRGAVAEGRAAMRAREAALREELRPGTGPA